MHFSINLSCVCRKGFERVQSDFVLLASSVVASAAFILDKTNTDKVRVFP